MKIAKNNNKYFTLHIDKFISIGLTYEFDDESKKNKVYFVDYFDDSKIISNEEYERGVRTYPYCEHSGYNYQLSEVFDELYLAIEYLQNNFNIPKTITNKIKL